MNRTPPSSSSRRGFFVSRSRRRRGTIGFMLDGHDPEYADLARLLVDEKHPELSRFEIKRCRMSVRRCGQWLFVLVGGRELAFEIPEVPETPEAKKPSRRRRKAAK